MRQLTDRVGLGWREELSASILMNLDKIDLVEVILDDHFLAPRKKWNSLRTLSSQVPVLYHGVSLGLASSHPVEEKRLSSLARILDFLKPEAWSEHLAFVRAGGREIGHLAAPPRHVANVEGTLRNLERVQRAVGSLPFLENVATLIDPPGSTLGEQDWVSAILQGSGAELLLDLHNLYANAANFGHPPLLYLEKFPLEKVRAIHLSGGHWIPEPRRAGGRGKSRLLDDHVHDVPEIVFTLLEAAAARIPHPISVILERDGNYPPFPILLEQLRHARAALQRGRAKQQPKPPAKEVALERASL